MAESKPGAKRGRAGGFGNPLLVDETTGILLTTKTGPQGSCAACGEHRLHGSQQGEPLRDPFRIHLRVRAMQRVLTELQVQETGGAQKAHRVRPLLRRCVWDRGDTRARARKAPCHNDVAHAYAQEAIANSLKFSDVTVTLRTQAHCCPDPAKAGRVKRWASPELRPLTRFT
jgi:hypothetical protein